MRFGIANFSPPLSCLRPGLPWASDSGSSVNFRRLLAAPDHICSRHSTSIKAFGRGILAHFGPLESSSSPVQKMTCSSIVPSGDVADASRRAIGGARQAEAFEDLSDRLRRMNCCNYPHATLAAITFENVDLVNTAHQFGPGIIARAR